MHVVEAPNPWGFAYYHSLFLGGGISNCPDWQKLAIEYMKDSDLLIMNPRRNAFDLNDAAVERQQIEWEFKYLNACNMILFWFPKETLCPITLYELGRWIGSTKPIFLGCHPEYARRRDLEIQTRLVRPNLMIDYSLTGLCKRVLRETGNV